ncbi:hypothetical protein DVZ84_34335 [Streptomyces parvulus]|uniref:Uncharacterized protein n=1 Tax=Streptomyces parvulus TaxID=146923 RepID=A0A369UXB5_9ACTN|nr:hypothetical protein DVZ84_34335 [Streptomyces parvulus]
MGGAVGVELLLYLGEGVDVVDLADPAVVAAKDHACGVVEEVVAETGPVVGGQHSAVVEADAAVRVDGVAG